MLKNVMAQTSGTFLGTKVDAVLQNGGTGWRTGDTVTVNMNGRDYTIRVTSDRFTYVYASAGSVSHTTPTDTSSGALDIAAVWSLQSRLA